MFYFKVFLILSLLLGIVPLVIGSPFYFMLSDKTKLSRLFFVYVLGIFLSIALFELICIPMTFARCTFSSFVYVYSGMLALCFLCVSIIMFKKVNSIKIQNWVFSFRQVGVLKNIIKNLSLFEVVYLLLFLVVVLIQLYGAIHYSATYYSLDDATYITYSTDAVMNNHMFAYSPETGVFASFDFHRVFQSFLLYYGYISKLTGLHVTVIAHTVFCVVFLIISYMTYWVMAEDLFKKREDRYIFLFLLALIYMFGNYSIYSATFRLLVAIWQGKAVLVVVLIPLLYVIIRNLLEKAYSHSYGLLLLILSISSVAFSLMAVGMVLFVVLTAMLLGFYLNKDKKLLLYVVWMGIFPSLVGVLYLIERM